MAEKIDKKLESMRRIKGEKIEVSRPVSVASVMIICGSCGKPTRAGYKILENNKKIRACKKCGAAI